MALYDGFFDAVFNEETGKFDREYESGAFTDYFGAFIGSGVCVYQNPDSMRVRLEEGTAVVGPGYLFIQGYWLKNDGDYPVDYAGEGAYAVLARLNMGRRMIELTAVPKADPEVYPDALVLAYVENGAAVDTRHQTGICGVIDAAGSLTGKLEFALDYIDTEIEDKLAQAEAAIRAQEAELDRKIEQVQAQVDKIVPPPVGTIQFSASQDVGEDWLRCDGRFVSESDYPELVAALGKLTPSGDKFELISNGEIGPQISNGVLYGGRLWVYSYSTKKLYGVDVEGGQPIKEIALTSENAHFNDFIAPSTLKPICLSIVPHKQGTGAKLFLAQILQDGGSVEASANLAWLEYFLFFESEFSGNESALTMKPTFTSIDTPPQNSATKYYFFLHSKFIPYVISDIQQGKEIYRAAAGYIKTTGSSSIFYGIAASIEWTAGQETANIKDAIDIRFYNTSSADFQRVCYSHKNKGEIVGVKLTYQSAPSYKYDYEIKSYPGVLFDFGAEMASFDTSALRKSYVPVTVAGNTAVIFCFDVNAVPYAKLLVNDSKTAIPNLPLPTAARTFVDAGAYLWGKDIYLFFVGTGILFSRTLQDGDWGYLDTTSVLGTITQFGYLDYSEDEGTLYILGQDTANRVKAAKIVLNTLYDYANDGAWLPVIASDGVPAYIKAFQTEDPVVDMIEMTIAVLPPTGSFGRYCDLKFNGEALSAGTFTRQLQKDGTFTIEIVNRSYLSRGDIALNGSVVVSVIAYNSTSPGIDKETFKVSDFMTAGIELQGLMSS